MKILIAIGIYQSIDRLRSSVSTLGSLIIPTSVETHFLFVDTGESIAGGSEVIDQVGTNSYYPLLPKPRLYSEVMMEKMSACRDLCNDDTILLNLDDDMILNPWTLEWIYYVYIHRPETPFLSPFRGPLMHALPIHEVGPDKYRLMNTGSTLGGCFCAKGKWLIEQVLEYVSQPEIDPMFDVGFWNWISEKLGNNRPIYIPAYCSLAEHINFGSNYLDSKAFPDDHMSAWNYIEENPFEYERKWRC